MITKYFVPYFALLFLHCVALPIALAIHTRSAHA